MRFQPQWVARYFQYYFQSEFATPLEHFRLLTHRIQLTVSVSLAECWRVPAVPPMVKV